MSASVVNNFVTRYLPTARSVSAQTGLSPDFILGVAGQESGWGQHYINNNLFGIGNTTGSNGAQYANPADSFVAFGNLITTDKRYAGVLAAGGNPQAEAIALGQSPYNPSGAAYGSAVAQTTAMVSGVTGGIDGSGSPVGGSGPATPTPPGTAQSGTGGGIGGAIMGAVITPLWEIVQRGFVIIAGLMIIAIALAALVFKSKTVQTSVKNLTVDAAAA